MALAFTGAAIALALLGAFFEIFTIRSGGGLKMVRREKPNYLVGTIAIFVAILALSWAIWGM